MIQRGAPPRNVVCVWAFHFYQCANRKTIKQQQWQCTLSTRKAGNDIFHRKIPMTAAEIANKSFSETSIRENLTSRRTLAIYRIRLLGKDCNDGSTTAGFASLFLPLLRRSMDDFLSILSRDETGNESNSFLSQATETIGIVKVLRLYRRICQLDPILDEEIGKEGGHLVLSRLIKVDISSVESCRCCSEDVNEANQDTIIEIQDLACEIASCSKGFPVQASPFLRQELLARLPLIFDLGNIRVFVNQVPNRQTAQKDVGFVMWPSAVVLSRWLVSNPQELHSKTVFELGAGCGLTGLVAARIIKDNPQQQCSEGNKGSVILSDFNETVVKNLRGNIALNDLDEVAMAEGLDFYQQNPTSGGRLTLDGIQHQDQADLVLAADVICQPEDAFAAARSIAAALSEGGKAVVVSADSKHRFGVEKIEEACEGIDSLTILSKASVDSDYLSIPRKIHSGDSGDDDMEKTSGFVPGMELTMYIIEKKGNRII